MWISPNHPNPPRLSNATPPAEQGITLASFDRKQGRERLRVSLETFNGSPFVRLQIWEANDQGDWWPVRGRCVTAKLREVEELIAGLRQVDDLLARGDGGQDEPAGRQTHQDARQSGRGGPATRRASAEGERSGGAPSVPPPDNDRPKFLEKRRRPEARAFRAEDMPVMRRGEGTFDEFVGER